VTAIYDDEEDEEEEDDDEERHPRASTQPSLAASDAPSSAAAAAIGRSTSPALVLTLRQGATVVSALAPNVLRLAPRSGWKNGGGGAVIDLCFATAADAGDWHDAMLRPLVTPSEGGSEPPIGGPVSSRALSQAAVLERSDSRGDSGWEEDVVPSSPAVPTSTRWSSTVSAGSLAPRTAPPPLSPAAFRTLKPLGGGSSGSVFLVSARDTGELLAMKVIPKASLATSPECRRHALDERLVMEVTRPHPFVLPLRYAFQSPRKLYLVMEYAAGGDLYTFLRRRGRSLGEAATRFVLAELVLGLEHLHASAVVYRDLKLENILLSASGHLRIADFGLSKLLADGGAGLTKTLCGTRHYCAPEAVAGHAYGQSCDFWSLGVLAYELLCGQTPFAADDPNDVFVHILTATVEYPPHLSPAAVSLLTGLLTRPLESRLGCGAGGWADVRAHPFFDAVEWGLAARSGLVDGNIFASLPTGEQFGASRLRHKKAVAQQQRQRRRGAPVAPSAAASAAAAAAAAATPSEAAPSEAAPSTAEPLSSSSSAATSSTAAPSTAVPSTAAPLSLPPPPSSGSPPLSTAPLAVMPATAVPVPVTVMTQARGEADSAVDDGWDRPPAPVPRVASSTTRGAKGAPGAPAAPAAAGPSRRPRRRSDVERPPPPPDADADARGSGGHPSPHDDGPASPVSLSPARTSAHTGYADADVGGGWGSDGEQGATLAAHAADVDRALEQLALAGAAGGGAAAPSPAGSGGGGGVGGGGRRAARPPGGSAAARARLISDLAKPPRDAAAANASGMGGVAGVSSLVSEEEEAAAAAAAAARSSSGRSGRSGRSGGSGGSGGSGVSGSSGVQPSAAATTDASCSFFEVSPPLDERTPSTSSTAAASTAGVRTPNTWRTWNKWAGGASPPRRPPSPPAPPPAAGAGGLDPTGPRALLGAEHGAAAASSGASHGTLLLGYSFVRRAPKEGGGREGGGRDGNSRRPSAAGSAVGGPAPAFLAADQGSAWKGGQRGRLTESRPGYLGRLPNPNELW